MGVFNLLEDKHQFIWMSEQSGFKQLYLYNLDGVLIRPLTSYKDSGILEDVLTIDEKNNWVYYLAHSNRDKPYQIQLFRSSLESETTEKISEDEGIFDAFLTAGKDSVYIVRSRLPDLMQIDLYTPKGHYLSSYWKGNTEKFKDGLLNIEYADVLGADNTTMISTMILKPSNFDSNIKYPVVEYIYGGNFATIVPRSFFEFHWDMLHLANAGFIVVAIDGRGTPMRGKEFKDFSYGKFGQVELKDHIAALKQLGEVRPYMDMDKIGIYGHSWGGHFALRALLEYPDIYKAGQINAAAFDPIDFRVPIEAFMGCLPAECPEKYEKSAISNKLGNLQAPLRIVHGTADDDVPIEEAYKLVKILDSIHNSNYEFVKYQGTNHILIQNPDWESQMINFFVQTFKQ
jgi:dipeptidyl aminopeptidase/acylaminoacyl peptidase